MKFINENDLNVNITEFYDEGNAKLINDMLMPYKNKLYKLLRDDKIHEVTVEIDRFDKNTGEFTIMVFVYYNKIGVYDEVDLDKAVGRLNSEKYYNILKNKYDIESVSTIQYEVYRNETGFLELKVNANCSENGMRYKQESSFKNINLTEDIVRIFAKAIQANINKINTQKTSEEKEKYEEGFFESLFPNMESAKVKRAAKLKLDTELQALIDFNADRVDTACEELRIAKNHFITDYIPKVKIDLAMADKYDVAEEAFNKELELQKAKVKMNVLIEEDANIYLRDPNSSSLEEDFRKYGFGFKNDVINMARINQLTEENDQLKIQWKKDIEKAVNKCAVQRREDDFELFFRDNIETMEQMKTIKCVSLEEVHKWIDILGDFYTVDRVMDNKDEYERFISKYTETEVERRIKEHEKELQRKIDEERRSQYFGQYDSYGSSWGRGGLSSDIEFRDSEREKLRRDYSYDIENEISSKQKACMQKIEKDEIKLPIRYLVILNSNNTYIDRYTLSGRDLFNKTKLKFYKYYPVSNYVVDYKSNEFLPEYKIDMPQYKYDLDLEFKVYKFGLANSAHWHHLNSATENFLNKLNTILKPHEYPIDFKALYNGNKKCSEFNSYLEPTFDYTITEDNDIVYNKTKRGDDALAPVAFEEYNKTNIKLIAMNKREVL